MLKKQKKEEQKSSSKLKNTFSLDDDIIIQVLLDGSYISSEDVKQFKSKTEITKTNILDYLLSHNIINRDLLGQAISEHLGVSYADLNSITPNKDQVLKIPKIIAEKYRVVLFDLDKKQATITSDNPQKIKSTKAFKKLLKVKKINLAYSLSEDIDQVMLNYRDPLKTRFKKILKSQDSIAPNIIKEIINDALSLQASDIHFEPQKERAIIRFRVDGTLQMVGEIPLDNYENILNRIKVQANMSIDEHLKTQDGSIQMTVQGGEVDLRISIVPTINGEKIVIRLLAQYVKDYFLNDLGLNEVNKKILVESAKKPFGMILVTGPTGSGKTTTLYSLLKVLHQPGVNITTIEDPVEYRIMGVNQIQVNSKTNLTFARGLRSIVRQDPDIILVGEVRDEETAEISVNAALTGHLLLSTFHANDAATTIPRLLDMETEPFLLSSTLELIIAQRLVRKICDHCRYSKTISKSEIKKDFPLASKYFSKNKVNLYQGKGCSSCNNSGYDGRVAIFEFIQASSDIKELILKNPSAKEVRALARKNGFRSLFEDGIEKVKNGQTTLEELLRVAKPD